MTAKVMALIRYAAKGQSGEHLQAVKLLEALGMEGDFHPGGERQLCLITTEIRQWMDHQPQKGLCFGRFKENIRIAGLPDGAVPPGVRISVGDAVLRVAENSKPCHSEECGLFSQGVRCRLSACAVFAVVERGGVVRVGDEVSVSETV